MSAVMEEDNKQEEKQEFVHPLQRFPIEVWNLIFSQLKDRRDSLRCYNASFVWESMFSHKRTVLCFPELFKYVAEYLDRTDILNCRKVHPLWKFGVDRYLESNPSHFNLDTFYDPSGNSNEEEEMKSFWLKYMHWFESSQEITHFLRRMIDYTGDNPFISRSLTCHDNKMDPGESAAMWRSANALITQFGSQIWHCDFVFSCNHNPIHFYKILRQCLRLMPNLRSFEVCYYGDHHLFNYLEIISLEELVRQQPLPRHENLVKLKVASLPSPVLIEVLSRNAKTLEKLQLNKPCPFRNTYEFGEPNRDPPRLTQLEELCMSLYSREDLQMLGMTTSSWPLTTLSLEDLSDEKISLKFLFQTVGRFANTLKVFIYKVSISSFNKSEGTVFTIDPNLRLHLPHLETLKIYAEQVKLSSIDFIMSLGQLKELVLVVEDGSTGVSGGITGGAGLILRGSPWRRIRGRQVKKVFGVGGWGGWIGGGCSDGIIRFTGYFHKMYDSNIWEILSNLRKILIKVNTGIPEKNNNGQETGKNKVLKYSYVRRLYKDYCFGLNQLRIC